MSVLGSVWGQPRTGHTLTKLEQPCRRTVSLSRPTRLETRQCGVHRAVARSSLILDAPRENVWAVLADAQSYSLWVVGAKDIRAVEGPWPEPGSKFHHTLGMGPFTLQDNTKSLIVEEGRYLAIEARARPLGKARVDFILTSEGHRTRVTIQEHAVAPALARLLNPLLAPLIRRRNDETLRRLARVVSVPALR
jgi:uncharacterized protein YndB with AHSA1/START domain